MRLRTIYFDGEEHPLPDALNLLTDEAIDHGDVCNQTVIDLRDALIDYKAAYERLTYQPHHEGNQHS